MGSARVAAWLAAAAAAVAVLEVAACDEPGAHPADAGLPDLGAVDDLAAPGQGRTCDQAIDLTMLAGAYSGSTAGGAAQTSAGCDVPTNQAPELYFSYDAGATAIDVVVDVVVDPQHPWDALVSARSDCSDATSELACADNGGSQHLEILGASGVVSVIVDGTDLFGGSDQGQFTLTARTRPILNSGDSCDVNGVMNRCGGNSFCQSGHCVATSAFLECAGAVDLTAQLDSGATAVASGRFLIFDPGYYSGSCSADQSPGWPERLYRITVSSPSLLQATTDDPNRTDFDTVLYLLQGSCSGAELECNDDTDTNDGQFRSTLSARVEPGTYYLIVDTSSSITYGQFDLEPRDYSLAVALTPLAIDGGDD